jgi:hypothetical protein
MVRKDILEFRLGMKIKGYYETRLSNVRGMRHVTEGRNVVGTKTRNTKGLFVLELQHWVRDFYSRCVLKGKE